MIMLATGSTGITAARPGNGEMLHWNLTTDLELGHDRYVKAPHLGVLLAQLSGINAVIRP